jgi:methanogenic corrinoid protein MtbC1
MDRRVDTEASADAMATGASSSHRRARSISVPDDEGPRDVLRRVLEQGLIPRLVAAHASETPSAAVAAATACLDATTVNAFANQAADDDAAGCRDCIDALREAGIGVERMCLELLGPAARRLGEMWDRDECDFVQVTNGLWRIEMLLIDLGTEIAVSSADPGLKARRVLLAKARGADHTLGLLMVSEFFRRAGWGVWFDPTASHDRLLEAVQADPFDLIGVSLTHTDHVAAVAALIHELRTASQNAAVKVMIGGPSLSGRPELVAAVGADFGARDAKDAVQRAERALSDGLTRDPADG